MDSIAGTADNTLIDQGAGMAPEKSDDTTDKRKKLDIHDHVEVSD